MTDGALDKNSPAPRGRRTGTRGMPRSAREDEILTAAVSEFAAATYAGAQVTGIAARAQVSKALVLGYFGSKEKLYIACVEKAGPIVFDAVQAGLDASTRDRAADGEGADSVFSRAAGAVATSLFDALEGRTGLWALLHDRTVPHGEARSTARAHRQRLRAQASGGVADVLRPAGMTDPLDHSAATLVWENIVTALMEWWRRNPGEPAEAMGRRAHRIFVALAYRPG
ncbi:TetR family transcriptional regulator [Tsukamurella sp. 8F]|nr:TetR/AcrR family transcriptional regulator [Tsukamurella sp. 8F]MDF0585829.1 TetR family transcriptional regulator [Tsukamurella sp. 8F]